METPIPVGAGSSRSLPDDSVPISTVIFHTPSGKLPAPMVEPIVSASSGEPLALSPNGSVLTRALDSSVKPIDPVEVQDAILASESQMVTERKPISPMILIGGNSPETTNPTTPLTKEAPLDAGNQSVPPVEPKLVVVRGEKLNSVYPLLAGRNFIGRTTDKPIDIDLDGQEAKDRIWTSRQHAVITYDRGVLVLEDLNSLNGTFVNRTRIHPGQPRILQAGDVVQIGTVQLKVTL